MVFLLLVDMFLFFLGLILFNQLLAGGAACNKKEDFNYFIKETDKTGKLRATFRDRAIHTIPTKNNALVAKLMFASFNNQDEKQNISFKTATNPIFCYFNHQFSCSSHHLWLLNHMFPGKITFFHGKLPMFLGGLPIFRRGDARLVLRQARRRVRCRHGDGGAGGECAATGGGASS